MKVQSVNYQTNYNNNKPSAISNSNSVSFTSVSVISNAVKKETLPLFKFFSKFPKRC